MINEINSILFFNVVVRNLKISKQQLNKLTDNMHDHLVLWLDFIDIYILNNSHNLEMKDIYLFSKEN